MLAGLTTWSKARCFARLSEARVHWVSSGIGFALGLFVGTTAIPLHHPPQHRLEALLFTVFYSVILIWLVGGIPYMNSPRFEAFFLSLIGGVYFIAIGTTLTLALTGGSLW
jgi:hypothetical protein